MMEGTQSPMKRHYFNSTSPNNVDAAMQELLKSLKAKPDFPEAHMLAGFIYLGREQYVKAIRHFKRAVELKPTYYKAANNLGATYIAAGRWDDAIELFTRLVGNIMYVTPGHGHNNLGLAYYSKGNLRKAREHFSTAINLAPRLCPAHNNLGRLLMEQNDMTRAEKYLKRAKRCDVRYAEPHFHLGRLKGMRGDVKAARPHFEACVRLAGDSSLADRCQQRLASLPVTR
jgi:type IV pilus assembly protein PilF